MYPDTELFIDGRWTAGAARERAPVLSPATGEEIGHHAVATVADLDEALAAADRGFRQWRAMPALTRSGIMRKAAQLMRDRVEEIAPMMTLEQGKPLAEARLETLNAADTIDFFAEEARRTYGRIVPARVAGVTQLVMPEPVGPVAAFTPWNFPINQAARKIAAALAAGCSILTKGPEETPASCAAMVRCFGDAGIPAGVVQLVYGKPADISNYLIPHPVIRKISFTGSTPVGKQLAALAGQHMKRITMELGGHAPVIVFGDADLDLAVKNLTGAKSRNAGQVCVSPTRFLVHESVSEPFVERFSAALGALKVGDGLDPATNMGPVANSRRVDAMEKLVADAVARGATVKTGGKRIGNKGYFYEPTVLADVSIDALVMNDEPFGPLAPVQTFSSYDDVVKEANRLPFGLAAYAYTTSGKIAADLSNDVESGMIAFNNHFLGLAENPFGGVKDSGYGSEGGPEAVEAYMVPKFVSRVGV
jgi:succinate-semialdehyde dehydrogenase/glutarate-semialdehyde dehydrogenase